MSGHARDDLAEQRVREVRVVPALAGRQHELGVREAGEQLVPASGTRASPRPRRAARAGGPSCARAGGGSVSSPKRASGRCRSSGSSSVELPLLAEEHHRRGGERLRDRADAVLRVGRRLAARRRRRRRPPPPRRPRRRGRRPPRRSAGGTAPGRAGGSRSACSGGCKDSERPRDQLDRLVDVVVGDAEVRGDAQDAGAEPADEDALLGDARLRVRDVDADRGDVDADEVRLGRVDVDGKAGGGEALRRGASPARGPRRAARRCGRARTASPRRRRPPGGARRRTGTSGARPPRSAPRSRRGSRPSRSRGPSRSRSGRCRRAGRTRRRGSPDATDAFSRRAPSRWTASPSSCAASIDAASSSSGQTRPPALRWVCSRTTIRAGWSQSAVATASRICSGVIRPACPASGRAISPEWTAGPPASKIRMCVRSSAIS